MSSNSESLDAFDAIILGTGLSESILAAALSRVGYSVLHLDRNTYYGELESTHSLNGLLNYTENHAERLSPPHATLSLDGDQLSISLPVNSAPSITNLSYVTYNITDEERSLYLRGIKERDASITKSSASPEVSSTVESEANSGTDNSQSLNSTVELEGDKEVEKTTADAELAHRDETKLNRVLQTCISLDQEHGVCEEHKLAYLTKKSNKFILDLTPKVIIQFIIIFALLF
ncbi:CHM [Bugula neritina]|uniref:CHM n=1 Tax=Bugula neritina TaxID=10212 RepID=A0A7J7KAM7_BUGNE|nr:CHM [Bugula neritina]